MNYKETGFRPLYKEISVFKLTDTVRESAGAFPQVDEANCALVYGYIDCEAGFTLEVLAAGVQKGDKFRFFEGRDDIFAKIRIGAVENEEYFLLDDPDDKLKNRYAAKIDALKTYDAPEEVEKSRSFGFLDGCRDPYCVDDVLVYLMRDGLDTEGCWARIVGLGDHCIIANLLNEPYQDFGYHRGERIAFFVRETEDKKIICYSNMNPSMKLTAADLADGTMLKAAIHAFNEERNQDHLFDILELLRDSLVWIPCNAIFADADNDAFQKAVKEAMEGGDLQSLVGQTFTNQEPVRMVPDILQNGDQFFFPVFTSAEDMGDYGKHFSKVQKHFLETIALARNNDRQVAGIVVNAFSEPFVLDAKIFDLVEKMKSRLV